MQVTDTITADTTFLYSDTLSYRKDTDRAELFGNIKMLKDTLRGKCNYATFDLDTLLLKLYKKPVLFMGRSYIKGDSMAILFQENGSYPEKITVQGNSYIERPGSDEKGKEKNFMKGKQIDISFKEQMVDNIKISGQATSIYFIEDPDSLKTGSIGSNTITGDTINIKFENNEIYDISIKGGSEGTYFPGRLKNKALDN